MNARARLDKLERANGPRDELPVIAVIHEDERTAEIVPLRFDGEPAPLPPWRIRAQLEAAGFRVRPARDDLTTGPPPCDG